MQLFFTLYAVHIFTVWRDCALCANNLYSVACGSLQDRRIRTCSPAEGSLWETAVHSAISPYLVILQTAAYKAPPTKTTHKKMRGCPVTDSQDILTNAAAFVNYLRGVRKVLPHDKNFSALPAECRMFLHEFSALIAAYCRAFLLYESSLILFMAAMRLSTPSFKYMELI